MVIKVKIFLIIVTVFSWLLFNVANIQYLFVTSKETDFLENFDRRSTKTNQNLFLC